MTQRGRTLPNRSASTPLSATQFFRRCVAQPSGGDVERRRFDQALRAQGVLLAMVLSFTPIALAADEPSAAQAASSAKPVNGESAVKSGAGQNSLDALLREEEEMRRREEDMLRKAASKANVPRQKAIPSAASAVTASQPAAIPPPGTAPKKPPVQAARKKRALPRPTATPTPEPTLVKLKNRKSSETPTPLPTETPVQTATAKVAPTRAAKAQAPKPTPAPRVAGEAAKPAAPAAASSNGPGAVTPAPSAQIGANAAKTADAPSGLLREQLTALSARNRQLEAELETLRSQLAISETEVERLNDFLNEQGRDYLNRATGGAAAGRNPAPQRPLGERLSGRAPRVAPDAAARTGTVQRSPFEPARSLEAEQTVSIASVVRPAVGREGPSSSSAVIDRIPAGSQVTVERESQGWYRVLTPLGVRVWVSAKDLAFGADGSVPPIRRDQSSSILPPAQPQGTDEQLANAGATAEDRAVELLKQSMGQQ